MDADHDRNSGDPGGQGSRWRQAWNNPAYRFAVLFLIYLGIGAAVYPAASRRFFFLIEMATDATAAIIYYSLHLFSNETLLSRSVVTFGDFAVSIIEECTGVYEMVIFSAAVLAFPTTGAKRSVGLLLGIPMLYLFNIIRILVLMFVGRYFAEIFDFMHLYFWQATLILMITSVWLAWIFWVVRRDTEAVVPAD